MGEGEARKKHPQQKQSEMNANINYNLTFMHLLMIIFIINKNKLWIFQNLTEAALDLVYYTMFHKNTSCDKRKHVYVPK